MRRRTIIFVLSVIVAVFCVHNVYQGWLMVQDGQAWRSPSGRPLIWDNQGAGIQILSGGGKDLQHLQRNVHSDLDIGKWQSGVWDENYARSQMEKHRNRTDYNRDEKKDYLRKARHSRKSREEEVVSMPQNMTYFDHPFAKPKCALNISRPIYKVINGTKRYVPHWQRKLEKCGQLGRTVNGTRMFNLAELLQVRVYEDDKAKWTIRELKQWIHYMLLIGVEHIFLCDHYKYESEMLDKPLKRYIDLGLMTYFPWSDIRNPMHAQVRCYQHIIDTYKHNTRWQMAIDMDEYPFALHDHREGFLSRYLRNMTFKYGSRLTEISMSNYLMLGQGDRKRNIVIDRINRMTPKPANMLVKPIYRPERVKANIHHNHLVFGTHLNADTDVLRMLHYWGARGQDWGPDTPHTLNITQEMNEMRHAWTNRLRDSLLVFGELDAFSNTTGP